MNQSYRIIWCAVRQAWVVASEIARGRRRATRSARARMLRAGQGVVLAAGLAAGAAMGQVTADWTLPADGYLNTPANWSTGAEPGFLDTARFMPQAGVPSVTLGSTNAFNIGAMRFYGDGTDYTVATTHALAIYGVDVGGTVYGITQTGNMVATYNTEVFLGGSQTWQADSGTAGPRLRINDAVQLSDHTLTLNPVNAGTAIEFSPTSSVRAFTGGSGVGTGGLVVTGAGTVRLLSTQTNDFIGGVAVNNGNLEIAGDSVLGDVSGGLSANGGLIRPLSSWTSARTITVNAGGMALDRNGQTVALSGPINGAGALAVTGAGSLTLTGANTYAGGTSLTGGSTTIANDGSLGAAGGALTVDGETLTPQTDWTSSRAVTLNGAGLTLDQNGRTNSLSGVISGAGGLTVVNGGTLTLSGSNAYTGATTVNGATVLVVNGNQSAATGQVSINSGATLSGTGTVGGPVAIASGATLSPGSAGAPGTLTTGALTLTAGSILNYRFGQAGVAGGALNDLVNVNGNLTLAGTLNVTQSAGGTFGPGVYRVFNYTGALTDNGLALGTAPVAASNLSVQTAVANQVNLVNSGGAALSFWDGAGPANNGAIDGGSGTWSAAPGSNSWTDSTGTVNGPAVGNGQAIFQGPAGTVTVDNGAGAVSTAGMQFASDGYRVSGGALTVNNAATPIRVGDGTAAGAGYTATIDAPLVGAGGIGKTDLGTLVLGGANTYAGPTTVDAGTLRAGGANVLSPNSGVTVASGATLDLAGHSQTVSGLTNAGTVSTVGSAPGTTLTVNGNYVGNGGTLRMGTQLGADGSPTDRLVINGANGPAAASGSTTIQVVNLNGLGAQTTGNGIALVQGVNGGTTTAQTTRNAFSLAGGMVAAGAYEYRLYAGDASGAGEDWYLRSSVPVDPNNPGTPGTPGTPGVTAYRAEVALHAALPQMLQQSDLEMVSNLHRRVGDERAESMAAGAPAQANPNRRAWVRLISERMRLDQGGTVDPRSAGQTQGAQAGLDVYRWRSSGGFHRVGLYGGYLSNRYEVSGAHSGGYGAVGQLQASNSYVGGYWTYNADSRWYADAVLQQGFVSGHAVSTAGSSTSIDAQSTLASIEVGKQFALNDRWALEPQGQLIVRHQAIDEVGIAGAQVRQGNNNAVIGRLGVRIKGDLTTSEGRLQPYGRLNLWHGMGGAYQTQFIGPAGSADIRSERGYTSWELAAGLSWTVSRNVSMYGEVGQILSIGSRDGKVNTSLGGSVGARFYF